MNRALFLFAHQDDEYAAAPWILEELRDGARVACLYLTDGGSRVEPRIRDAESRNALRSLGVADAAIAFLGDGRGRIGDLRLSSRSADALDMVERWIDDTGFAPTRMYSHSYEGGHPDHDAAHVISAVVAARRGIIGDAWHFSLYNAYRCPKPFYKALRQLPTAARSRRASITKARLKLTFLCCRYRSQWRTWIGLLPGALWERLILGRESVVRFDPSRIERRPHEGELLYERLFHTRYEDFLGDVDMLRSELLRNDRPR
jgi:LmbE family N-acetylglucosaminyl deacetylase